eukprot:SAG11_NODE_8666_length_989_cov_1.396629_2_plen_37_part_00
MLLPACERQGLMQFKNIVLVHTVIAALVKMMVTARF